jgi:hypothetical protein
MSFLMACGCLILESVHYLEFLIYNVVPVVIVMILYTLVARILAHSATNMSGEGQGKGAQK